MPAAALNAPGGRTSGVPVKINRSTVLLQPRHKIISQKDTKVYKEANKNM